MKKNLVADNASSTTNGAQQEQGATQKFRGFASMDPARVREIASQGGKAAHARGTAHEFTSQEAREANKRRHKKGAPASRAATR